MKVIKTDNTDRELFSDELIADDLTETDAKKLAKDLNDRYTDEYALCYYKAVNNDYRLFSLEW